MRRFTLRNQHGFTLIELLFVIAIIGILATIAIPKIAGPSANQELDMLTSELAADIRYMQQLSTNAGNTATRYQIQLNSTTPSSYTLIDTSNNTILKTGTIDSTKFSTSASRTTVTYDALRLTNNLASQIQITSLANNNSRYIIIAPVTGRVRASQSNVLEPGE